jgi:phage-related protein
VVLRFGGSGLLTIPSDLIAEKNKLFSGGAFLELLEVQMSEISDTLRVVNNNEDIEWGGYTWTKFPFEPGDYKEDQQGEAPRVTVKVSNVARVIEGYLDQTDEGLIGDTVIYRLIHSDHLDEDPAIMQSFTIISVECDEIWAYFTLGAENLFLRRFPLHVYQRYICRYEVFKGTACGYSGSETVCDRTFARCIELGNEARFGGQPGIPGGLFNI